MTQLATSIEGFCARTQVGLAPGLAQATFEQKRTLVQLLIDRVLAIDDVLGIRYVVPTRPKGESPRFCHLRKGHFDDAVQVLDSAMAKTAAKNSFL
ncbi:MAG: hypothetical protein WA324_06005 [Bryobacteraceae bacterium]